MIGGAISILVDAAKLVFGGVIAALGVLYAIGRVRRALRLRRGRGIGRFFG